MSKSAGGQMRTGYNGQIAIFWSQTEVDGLEAAPLAHLVVGSSWSWRGRGVQLTAGADQVVQQADATGLGSVLAARAGMANPGEIDECAKIELSNGAQTFVAELVREVNEASLVLVFEDGCPEPGQEFWVSAAASQIEPVEIDSGYDDKVVVFPAVRAGASPLPVSLSNTAGWAAE